MNTRSKVVELSGSKFHLRRLPPEVGSFIFMRMLGVSMRSRAAEAEEGASRKPLPADPAAAPVPARKPTGEMQVRALSFSVFSGGMGFEDFKFVQGACMRVVSLVETRAGEEFPMPIMTGDGAWTPQGEDLAADAGLVMRLTTEVLIFCFADFFGESGPGL